jgi:SAM-dependent methyltransferase
MGRVASGEADAEFPVDQYLASCSVCGLEQVFVRAARAVRETYRCSGCLASLRERAQATEILRCVGEPEGVTLAAWAGSEGAARLDIYEPGTSGPFRRYLTHLPRYQRSDFYAEPAQATDEVPHESLEALTFPDRRFDLVITSDILEHVARPGVAFAEIARVLRPGGHHVFTVPFTYPYPSESVTRAVLEGDAVTHLLEPRYHGDGKGGRSLVFTDFGLDIVAMVGLSGVDAELRNAGTGSPIADRALTVVCTRTS